MNSEVEREIHIRHGLVDGSAGWGALWDLVHPDRMGLDVFSNYIVHEIRRCVSLDRPSCSMGSRDLVSAIQECRAVSSVSIDVQRDYKAGDELTRPWWSLLKMSGKCRIAYSWSSRKDFVVPNNSQSSRSSSVWIGSRSDQHTLAARLSIPCTRGHVP